MLYKTNIILVFKTDIENCKRLELIAPSFNHEKDIVNWSVDLNDVDNVLRVETNTSMAEKKVIELLSRLDIACEIVPM